MKKPKKPTSSQARLLYNIYHHDDVAHHCRSQSDYAGLFATVGWASRNGYIAMSQPGGEDDGKWRLTPEGLTYVRLFKIAPEEK